MIPVQRPPRDTDPYAVIREMGSNGTITAAMRLQP